MGFDRVFDLLKEPQRFEGQDNYPTYDIVRTGEETYRISLALAGFSPEDITVTVQQNMLSVAGRKPDQASQKSGQKSGHEYLYQGIAAREFERQFSLEDHVEVEGASFENGLLQIHLVRRIPAPLKPRRINFATAKPT